MRRSGMLVFAALGLALGVGVMTVHAQGDIRGVSFRPTDAMPAGTGAGQADISAASDGTYTVKADFSKVTDSLVLDDYDGATAFVVWGVDMKGAEHNAGALTKDSVLEDASIDYLPSGLLLSAEADPAATARKGDILFKITLRQVDKAAAANATATGTAAAEPTAAPTKAAAATSTKPKVLPTTGSLFRDLAVLAAVGFALLLAGMQLKRVRPLA